jgi:hypothetical protein
MNPVLSVYQRYLPVFQMPVCTMQRTLMKSGISSNAFNFCLTADDLSIIDDKLEKTVEPE